MMDSSNSISAPHEEKQCEASEKTDEHILEEDNVNRQAQQQDQSILMIPQSKPINSTRLRRFCTLAAIKLLRKIRPSVGGILFVTNDLCIKYGQTRHLPEASTMQFVAKHTSIPVPKIYCAFTRKGRTYIVMERIKGDMVGRQWLSRSAESKAEILSQLKQMIQEIRRIPPPRGQGISNVDGGILWDCRLPHSEIFGPFSTIHDFHKYLREGYDGDTHQYPEINKLTTMHRKCWPPPVFTHGDLSSLNILVRGDDIVGIIDWETAGWFPSYWEYTTACQVNPRNYFWRDEIDKFLEPMPEELEMERIRQRYFGDF